MTRCGAGLWVLHQLEGQLYRIGEAADCLQGFIAMLELDYASSFGLSLFVLHQTDAITICKI